LKCRDLAGLTLEMFSDLLSRQRAASRSYSRHFRFGCFARSYRVGFVPAIAMVDIDAPPESFPGDDADGAASLGRLPMAALGHRRSMICSELRNACARMAD
jgi:hypothetical protein